jgi:hypothetical protein
MQAPIEVLLLHDGQLADVTALLTELEIEWVEGRSASVVSGTPPLVIGTPQHLLRLADVDPGGSARIALCDGGSRGLDRKLEARGIDFVLRRPVHPTALRLLILHMIYRGPERRRLRRVNAGVPVRFRCGWWPRRGLLLEFSVGGCSLLSDEALPAGKRIRVAFPAEIGLGRKLVVKGRVVRTKAAPAGAAGEHVVAVDFGDLSLDTHQRLAAAVVARARPAPMVDAPTRAEALASGQRPETEIAERRRLPRARYTKAVHGRMEDEKIVLMGSNLSPRGMQIDPEPRLGLGRSVKLDLYGHGDIPPIRLEARVARDDGELGLFLEFVNLWPGAPALLERLVKTLPVMAPGEGGMVISEVVERS